MEYEKENTGNMVVLRSSAVQNENTIWLGFR